MSIPLFMGGRAYMNGKLIYAGYGHGNQVFDVTAIVQKQLNDGTTKFNANSDTYGDPCSGTKKALFIVWEDNGKMYSGTSIDWDNTWFTC
jgi:hypothetical protein